MTLINNFQLADFGGRRKVVKVTLYAMAQMEVDLLRRCATSYAMTEQEAVRFAIHYAASELVKQDPVAAAETSGPRETDPMGWKIGYKTSGKRRLQDWLVARLAVAQGEELAMLKTIEHAEYTGRMNALREFWRARE